MTFRDNANGMWCTQIKFNDTRVCGDMFSKREMGMTLEIRNGKVVVDGDTHAVKWILPQSPDKPRDGFAKIVSVDPPTSYKEPGIVTLDHPAFAKTDEGRGVQISAGKVSIVGGKFHATSKWRA